MKLIIKDTTRPLRGAEHLLSLSPEETILPCIGCYHCWIQTPGQCVLKDSFCSMPSLLSEVRDLFLVSRMCYGSVSPFVKNVLDRSLGTLLPFFELKEGLSIHPLRYEHPLRLHYCIYDDASEGERRTLQALAKANGRNLEAETRVSFFSSWEALQEAMYDDWTD